MLVNFSLPSDVAGFLSGFVEDVEHFFVGHRHTFL
jgi:hypothetical protein